MIDLPDTPGIGVFSTIGFNDFSETLEHPILLSPANSGSYGVGAAVANLGTPSAYEPQELTCENVVSGEAALPVDVDDLAFGTPSGATLLDDPPEAIWISCTARDVGLMAAEDLTNCSAGFDFLAPASTGRSFRSSRAEAGEVLEMGTVLEARITFVGTLDDTLDANPDALEGDDVPLEIWFRSERCQ